MNDNPYQTPKSDLNDNDIPTQFFQGRITASRLKVTAWLVLVDIVISIILDALYYSDIRYQEVRYQYVYQYLTVLSCFFWLYIYFFLIRYFELRYQASLHVIFYVFMAFAVVFTVFVIIGDYIDQPQTFTQYSNAYNVMSLAYIALSVLFVRNLLRIKLLHKSLKLFAWFGLASACLLYIAVLYPVSAALEYVSSFFLARALLLSASELKSTRQF